jgi:hypothetical protein
MSKEALKEVVVGWANGDGSKTEMWLKVLSEHQVDDLESLRLLEPDLFIRLLEKLDQPILCQHLRNWYRNEFPDSKASLYFTFYRLSSNRKPRFGTKN